MQSKTELIKDFIEKYIKAGEAIEILKDDIKQVIESEGSNRRRLAYEHGCSHRLFEQIGEASRIAYLEECKNVLAKLESELKEIEDMVEIKNG